MKKLLSFRSRVGPKLASMLALTLVCGTSAFATPLGTDITYFDNEVGAGGYSGSGDTRLDADGALVREDQETEPGTVTVSSEPRWDLEGVFLNGANLSIVGQFPFGTGIGGPTDAGYFSGDIFLSVNPTLSDVENPNNNGSGYQFVIDITATDTMNGGFNPDGFGGYTYTIYDITGFTTTGGGLWSVAGGPDIGPNPYRYRGAGTDGAGTVVDTGSFDLYSYAGFGGVDDPDFAGTTPHYVMSGFDLSGLGLLLGDDLFVHYTIECGNDLLTGYVNGYTPPPPPVPEPATMLIMGLGLASAALGKRSVKRLIS